MTSDCEHEYSAWRGMQICDICGEIKEDGE